MQDAREGHDSHPPNPGAPRRALPQARPQRAKRRRRTGDPLLLRNATGESYVEPLSDARTPLADFFRMLLGVADEITYPGATRDRWIMHPVRLVLT
jgi:hypothetical protein